VDSFLPWYGAGGFNINGWDSEFWAVFGILLGLAAVVILGLTAFDVTDVNLGALKTEQIALLLGGLSTVFLLLRWLTENNLTKYGLYLGILSAAAITFGSFMAMKEAGLGMPGADDFRSFGGGGGDEPPPPPPPSQ
jgi:hypothetical protein